MFGLELSKGDQNQKTPLIEEKRKSVLSNVFSNMTHKDESSYFRANTVTQCRKIQMNEFEHNDEPKEKRFYIEMDHRDDYSQKSKPSIMNLFLNPKKALDTEEDDGKIYGTEENERGEKETDVKKPEECIHWYYGDLSRRLTTMDLKEKKYAKEGRPDPEALVHIQDMIPRKAESKQFAWLRVFCCKKADPCKRCGVQIDENEEFVERIDRVAFWSKLFVFFQILIVEVGDRFSMLGDWDMDCNNNISLHYFNCLNQSTACNNIISDNNKLFYCTKDDWFNQTNNFCEKGYCHMNNSTFKKVDKTHEHTMQFDRKEYCDDSDYKNRVVDLHKKWRDCMYKKENGNSCSMALSNAGPDFGNCTMGIEIFLFVFLVKEIVIEIVLEKFEDKYYAKRPKITIVVKILTIIGSIWLWTTFVLWEAKTTGVEADDVVELLYVVFFIGALGLQQCFKLIAICSRSRKEFTLNDQNSVLNQKDTLETVKEESDSNSISTFRDIFKSRKQTVNNKALEARKQALAAKMDEWEMKVSRDYQKSRLMVYVLLVPIWSSFLLVILTMLGGNIVNIIYFGLTPIDSLVDGIFSRQFLSLINGIFVSTHRKQFKYRSVITILIKIALMMNIFMVTVQIGMIGYMIQLIFTKHFYYDNSYIQKNLIGDIVIIVWFLFDMLTNCGQIYQGTFIQEYSYLFANDVSMRHLEEQKVKIDHLMENDPTMGFGKAYKNKVLGKLNLKLIGLDEKIFYEDVKGPDSNPNRNAWHSFYTDLKVHSQSVEAKAAKKLEEAAKKNN